MTRLSPCTIAVLLGGSSAEREVSLRTGTAVAQALQSRGHLVHRVDPAQPNWTIPPGTRVVFLALHGTHGEDGTMQEHLERLGLPYTGCGPAASRLAFDKALTKEHLLAAGLPTPRSLVLDQPRTPWPRDWIPPLVLKPVCQGSSVGLQFVEDRAQWTQALADALQHDSRVLVEERIIGRETTVGILDGQALPIVEIRPRQGAYDYANKYTSGATDYFVPADFPAPVAHAIQEAALGAFAALGCRDYARVDIMVDARLAPWILEVNTLPGMTETSLLPKAAAAAGLSYPDLCERMIALALARTAAPARRS